MEIKTPNINPNYKIIKQEIQTALTPKTKKQNDKTGTRIYPFIKVDICDNLIYQNVYLKKCIETLSEDTIYNDITVLGDNEETGNLIKQFWEKSQDEMQKQAVDYYSYGFGASEVIFDNTGKPVKLVEIQADTLYIKKEKNTPTEQNPTGISYYAVQSLAGQDDIKMRLHFLDYDETDDDLPVCFWLGGGRKSNFYDYPCWIECFNHVSASVNLDLLNAQKIVDGNLVSGILTIIRPPAATDPNAEDLDDTLENKMRAKGNGIFTLELKTLNPNIPLTVDYIQISESNYDYLSELGKASDSKILSTFKIPKARLLIDDTTESMNSNKTNTLYKIYTGELQNRQRQFENSMREFNRLFFEYDVRVDIETPVFVDDKEIEANITINLFNNSLITLGQAITKIGKIYPEFNDLEIDTDNVIYGERYYNGKPLGLTNTDDEENRLNMIGELIETTKINNILSTESENR
ncbi:hypothetical protein [Methanobrevibacter sp.]